MLWGDNALLLSQIFFKTYSQTYGIWLEGAVVNSIYVANLEINTDQLPIKFKMGTQGKTEQNSV